MSFLLLLKIGVTAFGILFIVLFECLIIREKTSNNKLRIRLSKIIDLLVRTVMAILLIMIVILFIQLWSS